MGLPVRISAVTLICRDIGRVAAFYRQFGWPEAPASVPEHVVFQCANGVVLGLFSETVLEPRYGRLAEGFRGFTLTIHCEDEETVVRAHERIREFADVAELDAESRHDQVGAMASASVTPRTTSGVSPASTAPTSITVAVSPIRSDQRLV